MTSAPALYVAHMGDDLMVANAARRSFDAGHLEWSDEARTPRGRSDRELVDALAADGHELPFRHPHVVLACQAPVPVARQLSKHQVGMSWSEVSRRYKTGDITCACLKAWRGAAADVRHGSGAELAQDVQNTLWTLQLDNVERGMRDYREALRLGAAPEQARFLLPQSMDVRWTWTGSLLAWANLCRRRGGWDAQGETRAWCAEAAAIIEPLFPVSWAALMRPPAAVAGMRDVADAEREQVA